MIDRLGRNMNNPLWHSITIGNTFGTPEANQRFEVLEHLGCGAFGEVYKVRNLHVDSLSAMKTLKCDYQNDEATLRHFDQEGRLWCNLSNEPNVVSATGFHIFLDQGQRPFLEMEFVHGTSLKAILAREGPHLAPAQMVQYAINVCAGLRDIHDPRRRQDVLIHRDISPDNIMISHGRMGTAAKVTDFGLARYANDQTIGSIVGKWLYMAPEIIKHGGWQHGDEGIDHRADIYSLGVTVYQGLSGSFPISRRSDEIAMKDAILHTLPAKLCMPKHTGTVSPFRDLKQLIMACIEKRASDRPQSWDILAAKFSELVPILIDNHDGQKCTDCHFLSTNSLRSARCPVCNGKLGRISGVTSVRFTEAHTVLDETKESDEEPVEFVGIPAGPAVFGCNATFMTDLAHVLKSRNYDPAYAERWSKRQAVRDALPRYEISKTPITVGQYSRFIRKTGYSPEGSIRRSPGDWPVTNVTWRDVDAFCDWSDARLPTAEEWEKAARGLDGRPYPWGNEWSPDRCVCAERNSDHPESVQAHPLGGSPFGLLDCTGNVGEMVASGNDSNRFVLGGSFEEPCQFLGILWNRDITIGPTSSHESVGFRVVRDVARHELPQITDRFVSGPKEAALGCDETYISLLECRLPLGETIRRELRQNRLRVVRQPAYRIGRYPVTNEDYWEFVLATGYRRPATWKAMKYSWNGRPFLNSEKTVPVAHVSVADAKRYCEWLNTITHLRYRLPTSNEWEAASRGSDGRLYPWGNDYDPRFCNSSDSPWQVPVSVLQYPEGDSPSGCRQMTGNVFEWVIDSHTEPGIFCQRGGGYKTWNEAYGLTFLATFTDYETRETTGFRIVVDE
jgi:formylglycine-generating enzyme required for sulfatase activity